MSVRPGPHPDPRRADSTPGPDVSLRTVVRPCQTPGVDIAAISVVSSAVVAIGTVAVNFLSGERQRKHETDLDFEARVWEKKSAALFTVIEHCRALADSGPVTADNRTEYALALSRTLDDLQEVRSTVDAFASTRCREQLTDLIEALKAFGVKSDAGRDARHWSKMALEALGQTHDSEAFAGYRHMQHDAENDAVADFDPDLPDLRARAERLLEAARESARRPKD